MDRVSYVLPFFRKITIRKWIVLGRFFFGEFNTHPHELCFIHFKFCFKNDQNGFAGFQIIVLCFFQNNEILLSEENAKVIKQSKGEDIPFKVHTMGLYVVIEAENGLVLIWNKKTTLMIRLSNKFRGKVCGLCGNYDGKIKNDLTTRNKEVVVKPLDFGNSWKVQTKCPNAKTQQNPCNLYSNRMAWATKKCSIITSEVFAACHSKVEKGHYYDACVRDSCACNSGGDRECFCSAVAAYAAACNEAGACVKWRTPTICPLFCDFYNPDGECEWHYKPCGKKCMKTCRNPSGNCYNQLPALEGIHDEKGLICAFSRLELFSERLLTMHALFH
uniref:VWFD domain-containing protein n=1 Tax=Acanthochromis polyacanthus TaxID=80966 RepID=A0A3Q1FAF5_9TELE